ncbi:MAG: rod shape-determining protein MreC [Candidatus Dojkabacteria bacterium]
MAGMKQGDSVSKIHSKKLFLLSMLSAILLITNIAGFHTRIYAGMDTILVPFFVMGGSLSRNANFVLTEMTNKDQVLHENINLRRSLSQYQELEAENSKLKAQIERLEQSQNVTVVDSQDMQMVQVVGVQGVFSPSANVIIRAGSDHGIEENDIVYYEKNTLFGFVVDVEARTSQVVPFYSDRVDFKIPIQNARDTSQKGFMGGLVDGKAVVWNLPRDYSISEGDIWVTTHDVPEVPPDLVVGVVSSIKKDPQETFQEISLELPFTSNQLSYVYINK